MSVLLFPESHYLGVIMTRNASDKDNKDFLPLGFMTPAGDDAASKKRYDTVEQWCKSQSRTSVPSFSTLPNKPMGGFRLLDNVKRVSRYNSSMKWRIEDPRGFELEISSDNMMMIVNASVIDQGEILDACIWGRQGAENFLVPVSSELYQEAVSNTEMSKRTISVKDMKPGDTVWLKNGKEGRYLGNLLHIPTAWGAADHKFDKAHFFLLNDDNTLVKQKSPKIGNIIEGEALSAQECLDLANAKKSYDIVKFMPDKGKLSKRTVVETIKVEDIDWRKSVVGKCPVQGYFSPDNYYGKGTHPIRVYLIDPTAWENDQEIVRKTIGSSFFTTNYANITLSPQEFAACDFWKRRVELLCDGQPVDFV